MAAFQVLKWVAWGAIENDINDDVTATIQNELLPYDIAVYDLRSTIRKICVYFNHCNRLEIEAFDTFAQAYRFVVELFLETERNAHEVTTMTTKPVMTTKERPVLVTTLHRGVFFGYATDTSGDTIFLRDCRNCVSWVSELRGFLGLAAVGPSKKCKIGPAVDGEIRNITGVWEVKPEAVKKWEAAPWSS